MTGARLRQLQTAAERPLDGVGEVAARPVGLAARGFIPEWKEEATAVAARPEQGERAPGRDESGDAFEGDDAVRSSGVDLENVPGVGVFDASFDASRGVMGKPVRRRRIRESTRDPGERRVGMAAEEFLASAAERANGLLTFTRCLEVERRDATAPAGEPEGICSGFRDTESLCRLDGGTRT